MGLYDEKGNRIITADPKPEPKKKGGRTPQAAGKRVERIVAKELGEKHKLCECGCGEPTENTFKRGHNQRRQQNRKPSDSVIHLVRSSLLGDGYLSFQSSGKTGFYGETHSVKQKEYIKEIVSWLGECTTGHLTELVSGHGSDTLRVCSRSYPIFMDMKHEWYDNHGVKILPNDLSWLDDFSIAKWYMDDGSLQGTSNKTRYPSWATNGFTKEEVQRLGNILTGMYGFNISIDVVRGKEHVLRGLVGYQENQLDVFWKAITPYVHSTMRYKIPQEYHDIVYVGYPQGQEFVSKTRGGSSPKQSGTRVERIIAKELGAKRTVGSGAFKDAGLTGDIEVRDNEGRDYVKLEVKTTGAINAAGDKVYSLQEKVLKQMEEEAHAARELGALVIKYKNGKIYVVMPFEDWKRMLEDAKRGRTVML